MKRKELEEYIQCAYGVEPDYPWMKYPNFAVYRHGNNKKWFALFMDVPREKLGIDGREEISVVNLKCEAAYFLEEGILPAYHMNKKSWVSVLLDGSVAEDKIKMLLDISFEETAKK